MNSIRYIFQRIEASEADMVINFYELLTGFTYLLFRPSVPQVCIGHQYLFLHKDFEFPRVGKLNVALLKFFTRLTAIGARERLALSFRVMKMMISVTFVLFLHYSVGKFYYMSLVRGIMCTDIWSIQVLVRT